MKSLKYISIGAVLVSTITVSAAARDGIAPGTPAFRACVSEKAQLNVNYDVMVGNRTDIFISFVDAYHYCAGSARLSAQ